MWKKNRKAEKKRQEKKEDRMLRLLETLTEL